MYHDLREVYWCDGLKMDIEEFIAKCPNSQQVKSKHQKLGGLLQEMQFTTWKREHINMNIVMGFPWTRSQYHSIWVIVVRLTKSAHFIPVKSTFSVEDYAKIYINEIVSLHWIPFSIIFDRGAQLTYRFWRSFQKGLVK